MASRAANAHSTMREICARCGGVFRGVWALRLLWCKTDEFYVCRRCWEWECGEGHGKGWKSVGTPVREIAAMTLIFGLCAGGAFGPTAIAEGVLITGWFSLAIGSLATLPFAAVAVHLVRLRSRRRELHRTKSQGVRPSDVSRETVPRDESLPWRPNPVWSVPRRFAVAMAALVPTLVLVVAMWLAFSPLDREDFYFLTVFGGMFLGIGAGFPLMWASGGGRGPRAIAVSNRGVHFWYPSPYERRLADGYIAWDEIAFIGDRGSGENSERVIERKNGVRENLGPLSRANFRFLVDKWTRRRGPGP